MSRTTTSDTIVTFLSSSTLFTTLIIPAWGSLTGNHFHGLCRGMGPTLIWFCRLTALRSLISDFIYRISETIFWLPSELGFLALCSPPSLGTSQAFILALYWCSFANFVARSSCCEGSALTCFISSSSVNSGVRRVVLKLNAKISS